MTAKLKTLRLCVSDLKESRHFYSHLFDKVPAVDIDGFVSFDIAGTNLEMASADTKNPLSTGGSIGYFEVENLEDYIERAKKLGAEIWRGPLKVNEAGWTIVQIKDGFGNVIGFEGKL
jgi:predicted enzyme related to lactoylglutathione lyase